MHDLDEIVEEVQIDEMRELGEAFEYARYELQIGRLLEYVEVDDEDLLQNARLLTNTNRFPVK